VTTAPTTAPNPAPAGPDSDPTAVDFRPGTGDLGSFPRADWERASRAALARLPDAALGYGDSRGLPRLRAALADYLGRVRGAILDPDDVVVVNGFAQGLAVVARLFRQLGIVAVGVEDPGSRHTAARLAAHDVDALAARQRPPLRAVLATPAHQFPTGAILGADRRRRLLAWADTVDGYLVEDDYDAEYRCDQQPVATVQGLAPDRVLLGGSVSKTLAPGLRLGWLVVPRHLADDAARHKRQIDLMSPVPEQAALAELLISGGYERHIRRNRTRYGQRRDRLLELLATHLPEATVRGEAAGLHLLVDTPTVTHEADVIANAAGHGLWLSGVSGYRGAPGPAGFVLAYAHLSHDQLRRGVRILAGAIRSASNLDHR